MKRAILSSLFLSLTLSGFAEESGWVDLFNGVDLNGWKQHGGKAEYRVEDGAVVGKTVPDTPNSFLCTEKTYGDFTLEFEFKVSDKMNSGVQFRSHFHDRDTEMEVKGKKLKFPADRVHGYQYEIDPSDRAWTAGVYDEGRRGWLFDLKNNEAARKAFKHNDWNQAKVVCRGTRIETWLNGVPAADFEDDVSAKGVIALQVHGIGKNGAPGEEVRWRKIRLKESPAG